MEMQCFSVRSAVMKSLRKFATMSAAIAFVVSLSPAAMAEDEISTEVGGPFLPGPDEDKGYIAVDEPAVPIDEVAAVDEPAVPIDEVAAVDETPDALPEEIRTLDGGGEEVAVTDYDPVIAYNMAPGGAEFAGDAADLAADEAANTALDRVEAPAAVVPVEKHSK
jgi:hypothetical protein